MKHKIKAIYDPIYRQNFWYICTPTHKQCCDILKKQCGIIDQPKEGIEGHMAVFLNDKGIIFVIYTKNRNPDLVAHEVLHAVSYSLRHKGLPLTDDTEEAYCYLMQFLMKEILELP